jgi:hypothetical protein
MTHIVSAGLVPEAVRASLVNGGEDTELTFRDGSTIVLKRITRLDVLLTITGSDAAPIGGEVSGYREDAHRRRNGGEGLRRVGEERA